MAEILVDGGRVVFDVRGDAEGHPLVLVSRQEWHEAGYVEALAHEYRLVLVDPRGWGDSDYLATEEQYTIDAWGRDLLAAADAAKLDRFAVWGPGHRGAIAAVVAARSDRISQLVCSSWPFFNYPLDGMLAMARQKVADGADGLRHDWKASAGLLAALSAGTATDALAARSYPRLLYYAERDTNAEVIRASHAELEQSGFVVREVPGADSRELWEDSAAVVPMVSEFLASTRARQ